MQEVNWEYKIFEEQGYEIEARLCIIHRLFYEINADENR